MTMKRLLVLSVLGALLGGCAVTPYAYRDHDDYYYHDHGYYRGDGYYRGYGYGYGPAYPEHDHGS
jgi:hypothetical protein